MRFETVPLAAAVIVVLGIGTAAARAQQDGQQELLVLDLCDATRIVGIAQNPALPLDSAAAGRIAVPFAAIRRVHTDASGGARVECRNGARHEGRLPDVELAFRTTWGNMKVSAARVCSLRVELPDWAEGRQADAIRAAEDYEHRHADFLKNPDERALRLVVGMVDGGVLPATTPLQSITLRRAEGGREEVLLSKVRSVAVARGGKSAQLTLTDGKILEGTCDAPLLRLHTSFGAAAVPFAQIRCVVVIHSGSWPKHMPVTMHNPGGDRLDYQVRMAIPRAGGMRPDFADIRFAEPGGGPLPYWMETADAEQAVVWVRVPHISPGMTSVGLHYGNPVARSAADPEATFLFFDDFDHGFNTAKWTGGDGSRAVKGGIFRVSSGGPAGTDYVRSTVELPGRISVESRMKVRRRCDYVIGHTMLVRGHRMNVTGIEYNYYIHNNKTAVWRVVNKKSFYPYPFALGRKLPGYWNDTWFRQRISYDGASARPNVVIGRDRGKGEETLVHRAASHPGPLYIQLHTWAWGVANHQMEVDWILVRRYERGPLAIIVGPGEDTVPHETVLDDGPPLEDEPEAPPDTL